jgi:uncharacterized protein YciI
MYLLNVSYRRPPAEVEPHIAPHNAWVKQHFEAGTFLLAGPKPSGLGGAILARAIDRPVLKALLASDPYVTADVAEYEVVEFVCKAATAALASLKEA